MLGPLHGTWFFALREWDLRFLGEEIAGPYSAKRTRSLRRILNAIANSSHADPSSIELMYVRWTLAFSAKQFACISECSQYSQGGLMSPRPSRGSQDWHNLIGSPSVESVMANAIARPERIMTKIGARHRESREENAFAALVLAQSIHNALAFSSLHPKLKTKSVIDTGKSRTTQKLDPRGKCWFDPNALVHLFGSQTIAPTRPAGFG